jgi:hypothetical protein
VCLVDSQAPKAVQEWIELKQVRLDPKDALILPMNNFNAVDTFEALLDLLQEMFTKVFPANFDRSEQVETLMGWNIFFQQ